MEWPMGRTSLCNSYTCQTNMSHNLLQYLPSVTWASRCHSISVYYIWNAWLHPFIYSIQILNWVSDLCHIHFSGKFMTWMQGQDIINLCTKLSHIAFFTCSKGTEDPKIHVSFWSLNITFCRNPSDSLQTKLCAYNLVVCQIIDKSYVYWAL